MYRKYIFIVISHQKYYSSRDTISLSVSQCLIHLFCCSGFTGESQKVSLACQVECSPLCEISWFKDGVPILSHTDYYTVKTTQVYIA
jgi:hypothetical protein